MLFASIDTVGKCNRLALLIICICTRTLRTIQKAGHIFPTSELLSRGTEENYHGRRLSGNRGIRPRSVGPRCFGSLLHRLVKFQGEVKGSADLTDAGQAGVRRDKPACWRVQGRLAHSVRKSLTSAKARVLLPFPHDSTTGAAHRSPFCLRWWGAHTQQVYFWARLGISIQLRGRVRGSSNARVRPGFAMGCPRVG